MKKDILTKVFIGLRLILIGFIVLLILTLLVSCSPTITYQVDPKIEESKFLASQRNNKEIDLRENDELILNKPFMSVGKFYYTDENIGMRFIIFYDSRGCFAAVPIEEKGD